MPKQVIIIAFNPEKDFDEIINAVRDIFSSDESVLVYGAIDDVANRVLRVVIKARQSNLVDHARKELSRVGNEVDFNEMILDVMAAFAAYGHSGGSASVAIPMINDLLQFKNLTPLTNDPAEWNDVGDGVSQNNRCSEAFSNDKGKTYYLLSEGGNDRHPEPRHTSAEKKV